MSEMMDERKATSFLVECATVDEANAMDLGVYRFSERLSAERRSFVFVRRGGK